MTYFCQNFRWPDIIIFYNLFFIKKELNFYFLDFSNLTGFGAKNDDDDEEVNDSDLFGENSEADSEEYPYSEDGEDDDAYEPEVVTQPEEDSDDDCLFAKGTN